MKDEKDKIQEPFDPERTPNPPQRIDPEGRTKQDESPGRNKGRSQEKPGEAENKPAEEQHLLNEDADISDETTV